MAGLVITAVVVGKRSPAELARDYRVSRQWVNVLVGRYRRDGDAAFQPRSRRPHSSPQQTSSPVEDAIVEIGKELDRDGHDAGAATIAFHLAQRTGSAPSVSTIWRILSARGFLTPQPHKRPRSSWTRFEADQPNQRWQADITHWRLADGREVEILNQIDDHSRLCVGSDAACVFNGPAVDAAVSKAAASHGFPAGYLTDNGAVFNGAPRGGGMVSFQRLLAAHRVRLRHSTPYHPQTCGNVERFHQSRKELARPAAAVPVRAAAASAARHVPRLPQQRPTTPNSRLANTPTQAHTARPKGIPDAAAFTAPDHHRVRQDKIDKAGIVTLRHNSHRHHIGVGRRHAGTHVRLPVHELHLRVITEDGELLRELVLDPSRDYQPQT